MMDIKIVFLAAAAVILSYSVEIGNNSADNFSVILCQQFSVQQKDLYQFVTFSDMVDKVRYSQVTICVSVEHCIQI